MAHTLILAEPAAERLLRLNEATPTTDMPAQHCGGKTTRETAVLPSREPLAMPLSPFMHNV